MRNILTTILLLAALTVAAQNYSPCYKEKYAQGVELYNKGDYNGAKAKFVAAKGCPMANAKEADEWIGKCNAKITPQHNSITRATGNHLNCVVKGVAFKMVFVEGGTFTMGTNDEYAYDSEKSAHQVTLTDFWMGETKVTQALWTAVMGTSLSQQQSKHSGYVIRGQGPNYPMYFVSYDEATDFCNKMNTLLNDQLPDGCKFVIPTEAQWEYAAKGGNQSKGYTYAGSNKLSDVAWYENNSGDKIHPVKTKLPNELGLYDMCGNLEEWCSDWYEKYSGTSQVDPIGPMSGKERVTRGCNRRSDEKWCRLSYRYHESPSSGYDNFHGFRIALVNIKLTEANRKKAAEEAKRKEEATAEEAKRKVEEEAAAMKKTLNFTVRNVTFKMVYVAGGTFTMGCSNEKGIDCASCESFAHSVTLSDYHIGETEVTQALWRAVMGNTPSKYKGDDLPVEQVNWNDCQEFCNKLNNLLRNELPSGCRFTLPTEAQWEYAAKGGNKSKGYLYSGSNNVNDVAWCLTNRHYEGPKPVKTKSPNELGLYDMTGNVDEWCQDWYSTDYFCISPSKDPPGPPSGKFRVCRGCNWEHCWVICREKSTPEYRSDHTGFRLSIIHN